MTDETYDSDADRWSYSRTALARLVLSFEQMDLARKATAGVPTNLDFDVRPGEMVEEADRMVDLAESVRRAAVIWERQRGTSWDQIGEALGVTRQAAHDRYRTALAEWEHALVEPAERDRGGFLQPVLHEAAYSPTPTARQLDRWAREHDHGSRDDAHPVSGHLPPLTVPAEISNVLAAIRHAVTSGLDGEPLARLHDRKAALYDRIHAEDGRDDAADLAAGARARAAEIRARAPEALPVDDATRERVHAAYRDLAPEERAGVVRDVAVLLAERLAGSGISEDQIAAVVEVYRQKERISACSDPDTAVATAAALLPDSSPDGEFWRGLSRLLLAGYLLAAALSDADVDTVYAWIARPTDRRPVDLLRTGPAPQWAEDCEQVLAGPTATRETVLRAVQAALQEGFPRGGPRKEK